MPGVLIGHNDEIAWGLTNAFVDVQDLYLERLRLTAQINTEYAEAMGDGNGAVRRRSWCAASRAACGAGVVATRHGPLISHSCGRADGGRRSLALRWTGQHGEWAAGCAGAQPAQDWEEFVAALGDWGAPARMYLCRHRWQHWLSAGGRIPVRRQNLGFVRRLVGMAHEWTGNVPPP